MAHHFKIPYSTPMRIYKDFQFEAAHFLPSAAAGTANARVHGHSFRARVVIDGEPSADTGYVFHFDDLTAALADTQDALDHRLLNEVEGLAAPTLERIAMWIWQRLSNRVPGLVEVHVNRDSCHEGCMYTGPVKLPRLAAE
jgi:6-pyruvoyltetrahydropterin/6-carboxytetrahydropterin synthase